MVTELSILEMLTNALEQAVPWLLITASSVELHMFLL